MTNSTPNLVAWLVEYKKYLMLVADGASDEASLLKQEIEEGLSWVELTWADLEFANDPAMPSEVRMSARPSERCESPGQH